MPSEMSWHRSHCQSSIPLWGKKPVTSGLFLYMQQCPHVLSQWMEDKLERDCATFFHSYVSHSIKALLYVSNGSRPYTGCWHLTLRIKLKWIYLWNWTSLPWKNTWASTTVFVISQIFGSASHPNGQIAHYLFPLCSHQQ